EYLGLATTGASSTHQAQTPLHCLPLRQAEEVTLRASSPLFNIPNVCELEDLIIDGFYQDVLKGKLDQHKKQLKIEYVMGHDLRPGQIEDMISVLSKWSNTPTTILMAIDAKMALVMDTLAQHKCKRKDYECKLEKVCKEVKQSSKSMDMDSVMDHRGMIGGGPRGMMLDNDRFDSREYSEESSRAGRMAKSRGSKQFMLNQW
ncbi:hypothetical protein BC938DRAFT_481400, partial [Jimgerdemannia flammicorona]